MFLDLNQLISDISNYCSIPLVKINQNSNLVSDLGIDGEDGYGLITYLGDRYNKNLKNINFYMYFGDEPNGLLSLIIGKFAKLNSNKEVSLTVGNLLAMLNSAPSKESE